MSTTFQKISKARENLKETMRLAREAAMEIEQMDQMRKRYSAIHLTNKQAAAMLGVSDRTIARMKRDGRLSEKATFDEVANYKKRHAGTQKGATS